MQNHPFGELPESLVEEVLLKSETVGKALLKSIEDLHSKKGQIRRELENQARLKKYDDLPSSNKEPTVCGIDGSFVVEKLLATDLAACAAVGIEGFIPPTDKRSLEKPAYRSYIGTESHNPDTGTILRGIVMEMEVILAANAPQEVVLLDGSFTSRIIQMNQAVNALNNTVTSNEVTHQFKEFLVCYKEILESPSTSNKIWASLPKYTTLRELGDEMSWPKQYDDRAVLTTVLSPSEFTKPVRISSSSDYWHLKSPPELVGDKVAKKLNDSLDSSIKNLYVLYYRPHSHSPAFRIEIASSVANDNRRLALLLQGLKFQSSNSVIMEPYPLFMADRMAKHLASAIPAFRQIITQRMAAQTSGDLRETFFNMHSYRTESGK